MGFGKIIADIKKDRSPIVQLIKEKIKSKPQFAHATIDYHHYTCVGVSRIEIDAKNLEKYERGLETRANSGVLRRVDNNGANINGLLFHYEKTVTNQNDVEGCLRIFPGHNTAISLDITNEGLKIIADMRGEKSFNKEVSQSIAQELKLLLPELLSELGNISRIIEQDRDDTEIKK